MDLLYFMVFLKQLNKYMHVQVAAAKTLRKEDLTRRVMNWKEVKILAKIKANKLECF